MYRNYYVLPNISEGWKKCERCGVSFYGMDYLCPSCRARFEREIKETRLKEQQYYDDYEDSEDEEE